MDLIKKHGEKILFVILLTALASSLAIILQEQGSFGRAKKIDPQASEAAVTTQEVERVLGLLTTNKLQVEVAKKSFTPQRRRVCVNAEHGALIPEDLGDPAICPFCGTEQTGIGTDTDEDGIPDQEELALGLNPEDANDVYLDKDGDGFFNLLEYQNKTNMNDPASHPPLVNYLRLKELDQKSILFELMGFSQMTERDYTLQLRWKYPGENRWNRGFIRTGRRFGRNDEFRAVRFVEKSKRKDGRTIDESYASIQVGRHTLKLGRYGEEARGQVTESLATLHVIAGRPWEEQLRTGSSFELENKKYMVIDILNDSVVVKADDSDDSFAVSFATPEEVKALTPPKPQVDPNAPDQGMPPEGFPDVF